MEGIFKLYAFLSCSRDSNISASCQATVSKPHRHNERFLNQFNMNRFEFYVGFLTLWRKILRETKQKVEKQKITLVGGFKR